ncbi:23S rRNA (guanine(745)-N(1))-methyltransferase [Pseudomonadota bacterium]
MSKTPWVCPVCRQQLTRDEKQYRCAQGHSFDVAKEGYVNLLPANHKRSADPGDDKQMLRNRREFLERGYYQPLAEHLIRECKEERHASAGSHFTLLDIGCGEGYFTGMISSALIEAKQPQVLCSAGIDISKHAIRLASKRYPAVNFAVASSAVLPVENDGIDCLLRIFAPGGDEEIRRVLRSGGLYIRVTPGPNHLYSLRELIYDQPRPHAEADAQIEGFQLLRREKIEYKTAVQGAGDIGALLKMTPYYWQANEERQARVLSLSELELDVDFYVDVFRNGMA